MIPRFVRMTASWKSTILRELLETCDSVFVRFAWRAETTAPDAPSFFYDFIGVPHYTYGLELLELILADTVRDCYQIRTGFAAWPRVERGHISNYVVPACCRIGFSFGGELFEERGVAGHVHGNTRREAGRGEYRKACHDNYP